MADDVIRNNTSVTLWRNSFLQRGYDQQSSGGSSGPGSSSDIHLPSSPGVGGGLTDPSAEFRTRSSSWSTWAREALWKRRSQNQAPSRTRGLSESESTTPETDSSSSTPKKSSGSTTDLVLQSVKHRQKSNSSSGGSSNRNSAPPVPSPLTRSNSTDELSRLATAAASEAALASAESAAETPAMQENLTFGHSDKIVYDIDGKFPYSVYESKPVFYDVDGVHRYKHYKPFKPTPYTSGAPHHETRPVLYDIDGKVTCYTMRDVQNQYKPALTRTKSSIQ